MIQRLRYILFLTLFISSYVNSQSLRSFEVANINFSDNISFSASDLELLLESKETPMWFWKFLNSFTGWGSEPEFFDSSKVTIDKIALVSFYNSNGFFLTKVTHKINIDSASNTINIDYFIDEGTSSLYGKFHLDGFDDMPQYLLDNMTLSKISVDSSKRYSQEEVQGNINEINKFLADNGYVLNRYDSTIVYMDTSVSRTNIESYFTLNNRFSISDVRIQKTGDAGNDISDDLIREIAGLKPGRIYSQQEIDRSQFRLLKTGLFTGLDIDPILTDTSGRLIPILIQTSIGNMNEISPEIKADNQDNSFNLGLGADFIRKNFLGNARKFTISTSFRIIDVLNFNFKNLFASRDSRDSTFQGDAEILLRLEQPFIFGRPILTTTEGFYRAITIIGQIGREYGFSQKFDFEMPQYTFLTLLRPFITVSVTDYTTDILFSDASVEALSITPSIALDLGSTKTDDLFFPTSGYSFFLTPEFAQSRTKLNLSGQVANVSPGFSPSTTEVLESAFYYRFDWTLAGYFSLNRDKSSVFAAKIRSGYIQTISGGYELIPPNKTFYAGGSNSVRGWRSRELLPRDEVKYLGISNTNYPRGGTFLLEGSFELREKIGESIGYSFFTDYGNTWNGYKQISFDQVALAVGFGVKYYSPIAPFRLDFGIKFYDPDDKKLIFSKKFLSNLEIHFGIGEAF